MNKRLFFLKISIALFLLFISVLKLQAQVKNRNAIKINPFSLIFRTSNITYERAVNSTQSFQAGVMFTGVKLGKYQYSGFRITPAYRFLISGNKQALDGIYISPFLSYQKFKIKERYTGDAGAFYAIGGGMLFGWEKSFDSGFVVDLFAGPSYNDATITRNDKDESFTLRSIYAGYGMKAGISVGFSF